MTARLNRAIADHLERYGPDDTLAALAEAHDAIAIAMGRNMPAAVRAAYEIAGRDDVLNPQNPKPERKLQ